MITARNLSKKFGDITALSEVSFDLPDGEFVFLTGPSGSGKTTLLRLILRELKPNGGQLSVAGADVSQIPAGKLPEYRRRIGAVFQDFKLLSDRNVKENIALPLQVRGLDPAAIARATDVAIKLVQLTGRDTLFPSQLSGGELQRVSLARAIVAKPALLLADEPTGNLDPTTARSIVKLLKDIHTELKTTVIIATHNADIVNHYAQRVLTLDKGKLIKDNPRGKYE